MGGEEIRKDSGGEAKNVCKSERNDMSRVIFEVWGVEVGKVSGSEVGKVNESDAIYHSRQTLSFGILPIPRDTPYQKILLF